MARFLLKNAVLGGLEAIGLFALFPRLSWRNQRLLILGYHGVSRLDEHQWEPSLYQSPATFESRLREIVEGGYQVLPLAEAITRLYQGSLPARSVALTFDDGYADFAEVAYPLLQRYRFPVTVYATTYYSEAGGPVFNPFGRYLLWKSGRDQVDAGPLLGRPERWNLSTLEGRAAAFRSLYYWAKDRGFCPRQKDELLDQLGRLLGVEPEPLRARRMFHLMRPQEIAELSRAGVDFQMHTHRHRTPRDRILFLREIADNRAVIEPLRQGPAEHLAYPSGIHSAAFLPWLIEAGVRTATTTVPDLASQASQPLLLPRMLDSDAIASVEFRAWLCGIRCCFPTRTRRAPPRLESPGSVGKSETGAQEVGRHDSTTHSPVRHHAP
jgi:peptidoglycan/xylan/chitin deacetylase (PgdA/CDA1 family)